MTENEINILADKWRKGTLTPAEKLRFEQWYNSFNDTEFAHDVSGEQLGQAIYERIIAKEDFKSVKPKRKLWPRIAVAAAIATIVFGAGLFYFNRDAKKSDQTAAYANDIAPGKQGATLTLANGKKIRLTDAANGELAKESGITISKTANGQLIYTVSPSGRDVQRTERNVMNTLSTDNGETYQVRLPDGSLVFLNAASSLKYPASFASLDKRKVELTGEGYFQVAKDKAHPFVVKTSRQEVEVLGTHFNINSYEDEPSVRTTLVEGSVSVAAGNSRLVLKPDQQAILNGIGFKTEEVNAEDVVAWKDGLFVFEDEQLESVMRKIARWYNVEVEYQGVDKTERIGGGVSKYENVSKVLKQLELTKGVHFKIEGRKIIAMK